MTTRATRSPRRRTVVALAVVLAVLAGFVVRLVDIQVVNAEGHMAQANETAFDSSRVLYGTRGSIVDAGGQTLAGSILVYDCALDPLLITQIDENIAEGKSSSPTWAEVSEDIAKITELTPEAVRTLVADKIAENPAAQWVQLKKGISTAQYRDLADLGQPYITCPPQPSRTYPDGAVAGGILGFLDVDGKPLEGLEQSMDDCLAPANGSVSYQKGADEVVIPGTEVTDPATDGGTLQLTIERDLQWYLQQLIAENVQNLKAQSGTITVVEVSTGKIRAAAEYPTVDPNNVDGSVADDRGSRIFRAAFEPGSTFKALTAATVMDAGGQTPTSTVQASGDERFANGARVTDSFGHPTYNYTLAGVLMDSSNAGASKFSEKVSPEVRADYLSRFGVGTGSSVPYADQAEGLIRPVSEWDNQTLYNTSFGQGVTTTVPELLGAYDAIANDGVRMPLSIVESCTLADGTVVKPDLPEPVRVVSEGTAQQTQQMLENVFLQANYAEQIEIPGYRMAGKTGTGEKADGNGGYKVGVYFTTLIGFAPADDPKYLVAVTLDEPTEERSSGANVPAFTKAMTQVLKTFRVEPSTTSPTLLPKFG